MTKLMILVAAGTIALAGAACTRNSLDVLAFQRQVLADTPYDAAFNAAEQALAEQFRIAIRDPEGGNLRTQPVESIENADPGHLLRDAVGAHQRVRRFAELRLRRRDGGVEFYCKVTVQHRQTGVAQAMLRNRGAYDQPTDTPADRDAGLTDEQNAVWITRARDRSMERQILASIREILAAK